MNKKLAKRIAVASLATLITIPNITTINYATLKIIRNEDGLYKALLLSNALIFEQFQNGYYVSSEKVGQAWNVGIELMMKYK